MNKGAFTLNQVYLEHDGGTKFYKATLLRRESDTDTLVIFRWGKMGTHGQTQVFSGTYSGMYRDFTSKLSAKKKRGYGENSSDVSPINARVLQHILHEELGSRPIDAKSWVEGRRRAEDALGVQSAVYDLDDDPFDNVLASVSDDVKAEEQAEAVAHIPEQYGNW